MFKILIQGYNGWYVYTFRNLELAEDAAKAMEESNLVYGVIIYRNNTEVKRIGSLQQVPKKPSRKKLKKTKTNCDH